MSHGRFTIDVEFLDLRIGTNNASIIFPLFHLSAPNGSCLTFYRILSAVIYELPSVALLLLPNIIQ
jgi:hypothetical protein